MRKTITITIDKDLLEVLKTYCKSNGYKLSNFIEIAIKEKLKSNK